MRILITMCLLVGLTTENVLVGAEPPLEAYGRPPTVSAMAISPDGSLAAFRRRDETMDAVFVQNRETNEIVAAVNDFGVEVQRISFLDQNRLLLFASENKVVSGAAARTLQVTGTFVYDIAANSLSQLLANSINVNSLQLGLGAILAHNPERDTLYMPRGGHAVLEVQLSNMSDRIFVSGGSESIDWFIDRGGKILATEEFNNGVQRIWGRLLDRRNLIHESGAEVPILGSIGISPDGQSLIVSAIPQGSDFEAYYELDLFDGSVGEPLYHRGGSDIERPLMDINRVVYGVEYSGFLPRYEFHDAALTERVRAIQSTLESTASYLVDWTPDFSHLVFRLSGGITSGAYVIVGPDSPKPKLLAFIREGIPAEAVAPTSVIEYEARDGLKIPALVTARVDVQADGKAPLIVLPHGGPSSYDRYEFDWLAQYFAGRGIVVLQPQFRGSLGFGSALSRAGVGEFGARMSTDLDDGVQHLIDEGLVDQSRVCMVGHSYGGYAALAAGAFSTFDYKCLVAIAGVSDWKRMKLTYSRMFQGDWSDFGDEMTERSLKDISPANFAKQFRSSVLLIHGRNDTIVPYHQSTDMRRALRFRGKSVELVRLKSEDHYLSGYETRLEALRAIESFLDENL